MHEPNQIDTLIQLYDLPIHYRQIIEQLALPLSRYLIKQISHRSSPYIFAINGAQGTGKSTFTQIIHDIIGDQSFNVATLSLDDFYYSRTIRQQLALDIHPLLSTRGVPGTHDVALALKTIEQLQQLTPSGSLHLPRFNKLLDEPEARSNWQVIHGRVDLIVLEGWCVATPAQSQQQLEAAINQLEHIHDADIVWRQYVNQQLATTYQPLFSQIDSLLYFKAPSFESVFNWRYQQERHLAKNAGEKTSLLNPDAMKHFISHYQRLTCHGFNCLPTIANITVELNEHHQLDKINSKLAL